jgi:hypothetical protein
MFFHILVQGMTIGKFAKKMQSQKKKNNNLIMLTAIKALMKIQRLFLL